MNIRALQQAIDRVVTIKARLYGLEFQAAPCVGQYWGLPDGTFGERKLSRLKLYRPCAPTNESVTDTALEMLARLHERFGPGKVWTLGHKGASERIAIMVDEGKVRTNAGQIMLRMYYVHERSTIAPHEEDPESRWPWTGAPRQYVGEDSAPRGPFDYGTPDYASIMKAPHASPERSGWEREIDGVWHPCTERGERPDGRQWLGHVGGMRYKVVRSGGAVTVSARPPGPPTCPLCGQPCERLNAWGATINGCSCVGSGKLVAVDYSKIQKDSASQGFRYAPVTLSKPALEQASAFYDTIERETDRAIAAQQAALDRKLEAKYAEKYGTGATSRHRAVLEAAQCGALTAEQARELLEMPAVEPLAPDPLYDGLTEDECADRWGENRRRIEGGSRPTYDLKPSQVAAAKAAWARDVGQSYSAQLRAKVAASNERERTRVVVDLQEIE